MSNAPKNDLIGLTAEIVSAHLANNAMSTTDVPLLIARVHQALAGLGTTTAPAASSEKKEPAVPIRKSVTPDYIVCLEDGKRMKMLKRHLATAYGMTPEQYREKWGLPSDYPMVSPNYAAKRSELAKSFGLGVGGKSNSAKV